MNTLFRRPVAWDDQPTGDRRIVSFKASEGGQMVEGREGSGAP
jgi:hypothetical protein